MIDELMKRAEVGGVSGVHNIYLDWSHFLVVGVVMGLGKHLYTSEHLLGVVFGHASHARFSVCCSSLYEYNLVDIFNVGTAVRVSYAFKFTKTHRKCVWPPRSRSETASDRSSPCAEGIPIKMAHDRERSNEPTILQLVMNLT